MFFPRAEISGTGAELRHSVLMLALVIALRRAASPSPGASAALAAAGCWAETSCTRASGSAYKWLLPTRELNRLFCFFIWKDTSQFPEPTFHLHIKREKVFNPCGKWKGVLDVTQVLLCLDLLCDHIFLPQKLTSSLGPLTMQMCCSRVGGTRRKGQVAPSLPLKDRHSQCSTRPLGRGSSHRARFFPLVRN